MSRVLHKPSMEDLRELLKEHREESYGDLVRKFDKMPVVKSNIVDNVEKLHMSNYMEEISKFARI